MSNPTNTDIMREITGLRESLEGIKGYADGIKVEVDGIRVEMRAHGEMLADHHKRIEGLESMRELVLALHSNVSKIQEDATKTRQILDGTDSTIADALRGVVRQFREDSRAAVKAEVTRFAEQLTAQISCLGCAKKETGT